MAGFHEPAQRMAEAQQALNAAIELLTHPSAASLQESSARLEQALGLLQQIQLPAGAAACSEAVFLQAHSFEIKKSVLLAGELLRSAAEFYEGWQQLRRVMETGYGNTNSAGVATAAGRRVQLEA